jgi:hypothetical protein
MTASQEARPYFDECRREGSIRTDLRAKKEEPYYNLIEIMPGDKLLQIGINTFFHGQAS